MDYRQVNGYCLLVTLIFFFLSFTASSQEGCGTEPYKDPWLTAFQASLDEELSLRSNDDTLLYVPITLHVLGGDNGVGYYPVSRILPALCQLNKDFEEANLYFYLKDNINYIDNSDWFSHDDIRTGAEMMFTNNVDNTINCYIVSDPAGNCGYNLPYAGVALSKGCIQPGDHTWAHEIGHNLSLPHPFLGWEGGQTHDNSRPPVFSRPAPEFVTYDYTLFKDVYYPDTLIIDTAVVERYDRSNCREAADGFCDTYPDYIARRWPCNSDSLSATTQLDPDSVRFVSDGRWIMSYSVDNCVDGFSGEQIMAMRANLREEKPGHLVDQSPASVIADKVALFFPEDEEFVPANQIQVGWSEAGPGANYLLEVSRLPNFGFLEVQEVLDTNFYAITDLVLNRKYYWRVTPFDRYNFCATSPDVREFTTQEATSTDNVLDEVAISQTGEYIKVTMYGQDGMVDLAMYDLNGRVHYTTQNNPGNGTLYISRESIPDGVFLLTLRSDKRIRTFKIILN